MEQRRLYFLELSFQVGNRKYLYVPQGRRYLYPREVHSHENGLLSSILSSFSPAAYKGEWLMQQQLSPMRKRLACLGFFVLLLLSFLLVGLLVLGLFSHCISDAIVMAIYMLGLGIFWLFRSIKKYRESRTQGRSVTWYTQPGLLLALAILLTVPFYIVAFLTDFGFSNGDALAIWLALPSILLFLVSAFFWIRGLVVDPTPEPPPGPDDHP